MNQANQGKLDCLLVSPPIFYTDDGNIWREINSNFPPLGLADLAGYVRGQGFSVRIIDCNIVSPTVENFRNYFKGQYVSRFSDIRVIGLTALTCTIKKAYKIAAICREYYPRAKIIFGGVHTTFSAPEVIKNPNVDAVIIGEGELTLTEILSNRAYPEIKGLVFKKRVADRDEITYNPPRERITDLDSLPRPAYDLLPVLKYRPAKGSYKRLPAMAMITSRGCPGRCTFCSKTLGNRLVYKSASTIFKEIKYLVDDYGIKQILFYDDTFTVFKDNVAKLCDLIVAHQVDISWTCFARVDFIDLATLKKMKAAGCHQIMYGVENIDPVVLKNIHKKINLAQIVKAVRWTKQAGIECRVAFMVGNPGDNVPIIKKNIEFIKKLKPDLLIVNITTPFPGTEMFQWAKKNDLILTYDWDDYTLAKPVMKLDNMSAEEIKKLYALMYRSFYFQPGYIIKKIGSIRSVDDFTILFSGFKALFSFLAPKRKKTAKP